MRPGMPGSAVRPSSAIIRRGGPPPGVETLASREEVKAPEIRNVIEEFLATKLLGFADVKAIIERTPQTEVWKAGQSNVAFVNVWRIEYMKAVPWPEAGKFYNGDCYVILQGYGFNHRKTKMLKYNAFCWLGSEATVEETVIGVLRLRDLERHLGGVASVYLEYQGKESDSFKILFPDGIEIMDGSVSAGFHHIDPEQYADYSPVFFSVDDHPNKTTDLSNIDVKEDKAYVLDFGSTVFFYIGSVSHPTIQKAATLMAGRMKIHRPEVKIVMNNMDTKKILEECQDVYRDLKGVHTDRVVRY